MLDANHATWQDISSYLEHDDRIILPVGSTEQHGTHLPLGTDWMIPWAMAFRLSERSGVPAASPVTYGMSSLHAAFPGTVTLKPATLQIVVAEILESLYRQGFRRVLIINGHGGNWASIGSAIMTLLMELHDLRVARCNWWEIPEVAARSAELFGETESHAGALETSVMMHLFPDSVGSSRPQSCFRERLPHLPSAREIRSLYPSGVMQGNPAMASAEAGAELVARALEALEKNLESLADHR